MNVIINNFLDTCLKIFYASFPIVKPKQAHKPKPWVTKGIKISCANKRKLYLTYRNSNNPSRKERCKKYCRILSKVKETSKKQHYNTLILNSKDRQKTAWKVIKTLTNYPEHTGSNTSSVNINGKLSHCPLPTANAFSTYCTAVAENLLNKSSTKAGPTCSNNPLFYLRQKTNLLSSSVTLKHTTTHEINKMILSLENKNSHGYDEIS